MTCWVLRCAVVAHMMRIIMLPAEAKGALAIFTGNRALWSDALALWAQVWLGSTPILIWQTFLNPCW
jgi:hypothetical protein